MHPPGTITVSTPSEHVSNVLVVSTSTMLEMRQNLGTWYSCPQNQALVNMRFSHAMVTIGSWATRIRQTREQGNQADDTDVCGTALTFWIRITIICSVRERDMVFNIHAALVMVITHLHLPYKQHWISTVLTHTADITYSVLGPGDEDGLSPLITSNTPSGCWHSADDRDNDRQFHGHSSELASVVTLQPTLALIPTPSSDDRNGKRRKESDLVENIGGLLSETVKVPVSQQNGTQNKRHNLNVPPNPAISLYTWVDGPPSGVAFGFGSSLSYQSMLLTPDSFPHTDSRCVMLDVVEIFNPQSQGVVEATESLQTQVTELSSTTDSHFHGHQ